MEPYLKYHKGSSRVCGDTITNEVLNRYYFCEGIGGIGVFMKRGVELPENCDKIGADSGHGFFVLLEKIGHFGPWKILF